MELNSTKNNDKPTHNTENVLQQKKRKQRHETARVNVGSDVAGRDVIPCLRRTPTGTITVGGRAGVWPCVCCSGGTVEQYSHGLLGLGLGREETAATLWCFSYT